MDSMSVLPVDTGHHGVGSGALGAFAGALFGSWFGDGFGGRDRYGYGAGAGGVGAGVVANSLTDPVLVDAINANGVKLDQGNIANLQGFATVGSTVLSSNAALMNATNQGFAGLNTAIQLGDAGINNTLSQGFSGLNTAVLSGSYENQLATAGLSREVAECCCKTTNAIREEGSATRQLIQNNLITELQTALCDSKAKVSQLEVENKLIASQAAQTATILAAINA